MFKLEFYRGKSLKHEVYNQHYIPSVGTKLVIKDDVFFIKSVLIDYNLMSVIIEID